MRRVTCLLAGFLLLATSVCLAADDEAALKAKYEAELAELRKAGEPTTFKEMAPPEIPDDQNAAILYQEAFKQYDLLPQPLYKRVQELDGPQPFDGDQLVEAGEIIARAQPIIELLRRAANLEKCKFAFAMNLDEKPWETRLFPLIGRFRASADLLALSAKVAVASGKPDEAVGDLVCALKLRRCGNAQPTIVGILGDIWSQELALRRLKITLDEAEASAESLKRVLAAFGNIEDRSPLVRAFKGERCVFIADYDCFLKHPESVDDLTALIGEKKVNVDRAGIYANALRTFEFWDAYLALAGKPWCQSNKDYELLKKNITDNRGKFPLCDLTLPILLSAALRYDRTAASSECAQQAVALRLYRLKHNEYPKKLSGLVPEFFDKLPVDPFSGKDYVYRKDAKGFILYSLGSNMKDNGGTEVPGKPDEGDIAWKCSR